ncbi:MAG: hypothetical protein II625_08920 [Bacilli bacterium]|nr:hypothetical protein [Bacilli bacterium]
MASYLINKSHKDDSVIRFKDISGYTFRPKVSKSDYVKVKEVTIVDPSMIDKILSQKFDKSFKRIVELAMIVVNNDDADEGDCELVIDQAELLREILLTKYQKFLNHEKEQLFLKKLRLIENEMRMKQVEIKQKAIYLEQQEEMYRSRGR